MLDKIFGSLGGKIIDSLGGLFTSDEQKLKAKAEMQRILLDGEQQVRNSNISLEKELTERLKLDMTSGTFLSKNIRPASLIFVGIVVTILSVTDGNIVWGDYTFTIGEQYVSLFHQLLLVMVSFYFGGRTFEKVNEVKNNSKVKSDEIKQKRIIKENKTDVDLFGEEE